MATKSRYVSTKFWDDSYIITLSPIDKLIFLYLMTNPLTNIAGIYEITLKRIVFDTRVSFNRVRKALKEFERHGKVYFLEEENWIIMVNFIKNQNLNENMKAGITKIVENLPETVKAFISKPSGKALEGFESLSKALEYLILFNSNLNTNSTSQSLPQNPGCKLKFPVMVKCKCTTMFDLREHPYCPRCVSIFILYLCQSTDHRSRKHIPVS